MPLSKRDRDLVAKATALIRARFYPDRHHLAAALRTRDGQVFTALNLDTYVGRCAVCAEAAVVARAVTDGAGTPETVVAVRWRGRGAPRVASPCGVCREFLVDYGDPWVIVENGAEARRVRASALLPTRYERREAPRGKRPRR